MLIFNPEHDLCLANGDPNFVAPSSAMQFGIDCSNVLEYIVGHNQENENIVAWGWNSALKNKLIKEGISPEQLPNDQEIGNIRELSHRRIAIKARRYISDKLSDKFKDYLLPTIPIEITNAEAVTPLLKEHKKMVFKAPWSGSGKGLRWANSITQGQASQDLIRWCSKIIKSQGSVIAEVQDAVAQDFAMLYKISKTPTNQQTKVDFVGYSLFSCSNGAYKSNILASDAHIKNILGKYIPLPLLDEVQRQQTDFLEQEFAGKYEGYLGIDMYVTQNRLQPCVEINVRMTMGLLAHSVFKAFYSEKDSGNYEMAVLYSPDNQKLTKNMAQAVKTLTNVNASTAYAIAIFKK